MFRPLSLYIGLRYTRAKKRESFVSFISLASMLGIALGVIVLITVLSVMNGFDYEIHRSVFSVARQVTVSNFATGDHWQEVKKEIEKNTDVIASAPFILNHGMLTKNGRAQGVAVNGILPKLEAEISEIQKTVEQGSMLALNPGEFGIVLGQAIAAYLDVNINDKIILVTPNITVSAIGVEPRFKKFTVVGIFHVGEGFNYDSSAAFINLYDAQKIFILGDNVTGLNLKIKDLYKAPLVSAELSAKLGGNYNISDWTHDYGSFFKAVQMEKTTMFVVLLFIIAVATFNLVSSLVMSVNDKQSDIAILRTMGASPKTIMIIFIVQGGIIGVLGTLLGISGGILLALNAPYLVKFLEQIFHTQFISAGVYFIDYLPSQLIWADVWHVGLATLIMSLFATIYPAWRASKTNPAEALRYE